jgi:enediyne polyketide synthase
MSVSSIAIVGMHCVYPGAHSPEELWENILAGRRYFRRAPDERLPSAWYYDPDPEAAGKTYCDRMAVITGWQFDPTEWKIPPVTVQVTDIVHWLALYTAREAMRSTGLDPALLDRDRVGVIVGNSGAGEFFRSHYLRNRWPYVERAIRRAVATVYPDGQADPLVAAIRHQYDAPLPPITEDHLAGNMGNVIAGRIANYYDFRGGNYLVDGACGSSLLAVTNACDAITMGHMDLAIAGGVDVSLDPFEIVGFAKTHALAKEDIRPFDQRADGMQTGEGCGMVVLCREDVARAKGYPIQAVIKGWGISSDGSGGITQPKVEGQMLALQRAYARAGYPLSSVGYVEGHGTGTAVGDKVEITALKRVLEETSSPGDLVRLGSIKANIGHTKAAAGVAGLIKAVQALKYKIIPQHVSCQQPNPLFREGQRNVRPAQETIAWESTGPRRASVSAFGFGGVNTHLTLEEANPADQPRPQDLENLESGQTSEVLLFAAGDLSALLETVSRHLPLARRICMADVTDLAAALARREPTGRYRLALVAATPWQLAEQLETVQQRLGSGATLSEVHNPRQGIFAAEAEGRPTVAMLFPGQGSQRLNMSTHLLRRYPFLRELCQGFEDRMQAVTGESFKERVFRDLAWASDEEADQWAAELRQTVFQQPAIVACSIANMRLLSFFGLEPDYACGHSLGEISALVAGGSLAPGDALHLAALRSRAMNNASGAGEGGMAAIGCSAEDAARLLGPGVTVSNINSPKQTVVSGPTRAIAALVERCAASGIWARTLPVSHAFHSPLVAPAAASFRRELDAFPFAPLAGARVCSTVTADWLTRDDDLRDLLGEQIASPVRFVEAVRRIDAEKPTFWIEVGPSAVLSTLTKDILADEGIETYPTDLEREDNFHLLNRIIAKAFVVGLPVRTENLFAHRFCRPFDPDHYQPVLIVNPCERPVPAPSHPLDLGIGVPAGLLPAVASQPEFAAYLAQRTDYLQRLIALDYECTTGASPSDTTRPSLRPASPTAPPAAEEQAPETQDLDVVTLARQWLADRTGFPLDFISADKRLRDDLNLDSIKAGELALYLSKRLGRQLPLDLGLVANASIQEIADIIEAYEGPSAPEENSSYERWVRLFGLESRPAPLAAESSLPLPTTDRPVFIFGAPGCTRTAAVRDAVAAAGWPTAAVPADEILRTGAFPGEPAALIFVLPSVDRPFDELPAAAFTERVEGLASQLFQLARLALTDSVLARQEFRIMGLRPAAGAADAGADLDGAAGLLKTLELELHKEHGVTAKWLVLPSEWSDADFARAVLAELTTTGERIEYHYTGDGQRTSPTAVQVGAAGRKAPRLGGTDTILVSGGGKGITFEMAYELARKTGIKLGLMGSSPLPAEGVENELTANLARLRGKGIRHLYVQADVTDAAAVAGAVRQIEKQLGSVTAVLHGAGISKFAEFLAMDHDAYLRCIRIKTAGLYNILAAVPAARLKALHVVSSVLGRTGMPRQSDYAFANAWLDGAVKAVLARHPHLHGFSIGYSVWEETGIGANSGSLQMLRNIGVTPLTTEEGCAVYLDLATNAHPYTTFVQQGRLASDLEAKLMPSLTIPQWRFLEKPLRFVAGVELAVEAEISHTSDLYIPEHVFAGTPLMPTVLGLEAMVQAAMACIGSDELPVIQGIALTKPMIIPAGTGTRVRTLALAEPPDQEGQTRVRVAMRSDADGFGRDHFAITCLFGGADTTDIPPCPELPAVPDPRSPESFSPSPLFQGRFLRRISKIYSIVEARETLTELTVPSQAQYYAEQFDQATRTPAPAIRDAMLQAGALMMPPGYLPEAFEEVRSLRPLRDGERLICWVRARTREQDGFVADIYLYDQERNPVEVIKGFVARAPNNAVNLLPARRTVAVPLAEVETSLRTVSSGTSLTLAILPAADVTDAEKRAALHEQEEALLTGVGDVRRASLTTKIVAAKRAAGRFLADYHQADVPAGRLVLTRHPDGKPILHQDGDPVLPLPAVSLTDSNGLTAALAGEARLGLDLEFVACRDTETWRGLLGPDGYTLALELQEATGESFDTSATRVWTLIEAGMKANALRRTIPRFQAIRHDQWLHFHADDDVQLPYLSALIVHEEQEAILTVAVEGPQRAC